MISVSGRKGARPFRLCCAHPGRAFSLVEVVLAVAVVSFAMLVMVALIPTGIRSTEDSIRESGAINVLSGLVADRKAATNYAAASPIYAIPALTLPSSNSFGVTAANTNSANQSQWAYRVTCVITPPVAGRMDPYQAYFKVSWPASVSSAAASSYLEETVTFQQP
jgi:uncharacterized protein (TIGR02598 family)